MAVITAFAPIDMRRLDTLEEIELARPGRVLVIEEARTLEYLGSFSFSGGVWQGRVTSASLTEGGTLSWTATGLDLAARYVRPGANGHEAITAALAGADTIHGSTGGDALFGFAGADVVGGGRGKDYLSGGAGTDLLEGGRGSDLLRGDGGRDTFVFAGGSGVDGIEDFRSGTDLLQFDGFHYRDLEIVRDGADTLVGYGENTLVLFDLRPSDLARDDFSFLG
jgi:Ca2+-binding RTX toxin-like protein